MNSTGKDNPPVLLLAFFRWFCHPEYREDIEGDLMEIYHDRINTMGKRKANWLFAKDVLLLFRPSLIKYLAHGSNQNIFDMKRNHWLKLVALNFLIVLLIVSPFIPGPSNKMVGLFSVAGQLTGLMGLFLLPVGLGWTIIEIRKLKVSTEKSKHSTIHFQIATIANFLTMFAFLLCVLFVPNPMPKMTFLVGLLLQVAGFMLAKRQIRNWQNNNEPVDAAGASIILAASATACLTLMYIFYLLFVFMAAKAAPGIIGLVLLFIGLAWIIKKIKKLKDGSERKLNTVPVYLVTIPLIAFLTFKFVVDPISTFSRNFAIKRSEILIASIETHKTQTGQYPETLQELYRNSSGKIPKPFIMGIDNFRYNKINDNYSLSFSQWLHVGSLEEIVLYDKNNLKNNLTGEFSKYDYNLDLWRVKGAFASHDTRFENWKYYHCD